MYTDRILGESRTVSLPTSVRWLANGNNLEFVGDLTSGVLLSTLDPQCEQPEAREFRRDIGSGGGCGMPIVVVIAMIIVATIIMVMVVVTTPIDASITPPPVL